MASVSSIPRSPLPDYTHSRPSPDHLATTRLEFLRAVFSRNLSAKVTEIMLATLWPSSTRQIGLTGEFFSAAPCRRRWSLSFYSFWDTRRVVRKLQLQTILLHWPILSKIEEKASFPKVSKDIMDRDQTRSSEDLRDNIHYHLYRDTGKVTDVVSLSN
ncbi:hypothetical protein E2C01_053332 [Portunus trituberculatus]|uniref:Uncharacterized protein n=1 Tax=Portunus trituberculatus TaxID=210409 RepID=A0A5B7GP72_PORTR|nr:hypothetical protein [Portunus trituberculatus]